MKKTISFSIIILFFLLAISCTSGKKAFERGDYQRAIDLSIDRLRSNPTHQKSQETLKKAYSILIEQKTAEVAILKSNNQPFKWDKVIAVYQHIHSIDEQIKSCPSAWELIKMPIRFDQDLLEAKNKSSLEHYEAGTVDLQFGTQEKARSAYNHFTIAQDLSPNLKNDYLLKKNEAKRKATTIIGVYLVPISNQINFSNDYFRGKINEYVLELDKREFLDAEVLQSMDAETDINDIVKIEFTNFRNDDIIFSEIKESMRDTVNHETTNPTTGIKEVRRMAVFADLITYKKSQKFYGNLEMTIYDAANKQILFSKPLQAEYLWKIEWAKMMGDTRALNDRQRNLLQQKEEFPTSKQPFFTEFTKNIFPKVQEIIRNYYNKN
ncbi:MAG: hypothetical protein EAZ06_01640 [Cytophagales bacterium]|nr:MAG: hypothetical protein EAZ06_01640 [Cytophagales bacterium]